MDTAESLSSCGGEINGGNSSPSDAAEKPPVLSLRAHEALARVDAGLRVRPLRVLADLLVDVFPDDNALWRSHAQKKVTAIRSSSYCPRLCSRLACKRRDGCAAPLLLLHADESGKRTVKSAPSTTAPSKRALDTIAPARLASARRKCTEEDAISDTNNISSLGPAMHRGEPSPGRTLEDRSREVALPEVGVLEVSSGEVRLGEVRPEERHAREVGAAEVGALEAALGVELLAQVAVGEVGVVAGGGGAGGGPARWRRAEEGEEKELFGGRRLAENGAGRRRRGVW